MKNVHDVSIMNIKEAYKQGWITYDDALARMAYLKSDSTEPYQSKDVVVAQDFEDGDLVALFKVDRFFQAMLLAALISIILFSSACAPKSDGSTSVAAIDNLVPDDGSKDDSAIQVPEVEPVAPVIIQPISGNPMTVTYYKLTETFAPISGWVNKTYTATGSCAVIQTKTYCWDDGLKIIPSWKYNNFTYGPFGYNYWGLHNSTSSSGYSHCGGGCTSSYMQTPRDVNKGSLLVNLNNANTPTDVNSVFTYGTQVIENCLENSGKVTCSNFEITLAQ